MNRVIILLGPTCVGKTGVSILLARALKTEIISADSMLVYRHMDIGTAKPSKRELKAVRHHLIDILDPSEKFSAGLFREKAIAIIDKLHKANKIPLIAGGTGLYIRSLTKGLFDGPAADEQIRMQLIDEEKRHGPGHLYSKLKKIDPEAAAQIKPADLRRTIRALEVSIKTKRGISEIRRERTIAASYEFIKIGLTRDRKELYEMIERRVDQMMEQGLLDETRKLLEMNPANTAMQALGYKEMKLYIEGAISLDEAVHKIKKRTKMFAKRQFTWFKKEPGIYWVDITGMMDHNEIMTKIADEVAILKELIYSN
jgi:tRNA dimethylallyltransferase